MPAATTPYNSDRRGGEKYLIPLAAGKKVYAGTIIGLNAAGYGQSAADAGTAITAGRATETVDNTAGAAGALSVEVEEGCFLFKNSGTDAVTQARLGLDIGIEDDTTLRLTTTVVAGRFKGFAEDGRVWVQIRR